MLGEAAAAEFGKWLNYRHFLVKDESGLAWFYTTTQQRPFYGPLSGTTWVSRYQNKHSPTHHPDHHPIFIFISFCKRDVKLQLTNFISFFHLPRSIASSLFKLRAWQFFCTTSLHVLFWSTSWSGALHLIFHTFLCPISVSFSQHMPIPYTKEYT